MSCTHLKGHPKRATLALASVLVWLLVGPVSAQAFDWPLDIQRALSSTFAETRGAGFHAGIDVKTWGKTGYPVKALADGYVMRVRTSPWGYGRAIYHKLTDGRVLVYAHLQDFAEPIAKEIEKAQQAKGRYSVDIWLKSGQIRLRRGQVIARTGQSGAGPPHLHLEIRSSDNVPINPLLAGIKVEDEIAPTLRRLALVPFGLESKVDGGSVPKVVPLRWNEKAGCFEGTYTPQVYGIVGVSLLVYDRADGANNKLAPFRIGLRLDGKPVGGTSYERVSFADRHQGLLDRLPLEGGYFFNLFRLAGNRLGFYQLAKGETGLLHCGLDTGTIRLGKGKHQLIVEASDVAGNRSIGQVELMVNAPPRIEAVELGQMDGGTHLYAHLRDEDDQRLEAELAWSAAGRDWTPIGAASVDDGSFAWPLDREGGIWRLQATDGHGGENRRFFSGPGAETQPLELGLSLESYPDFAQVQAQVKGMAQRVELVASDRSGQRVVPLGQEVIGLWRGILALKPKGGPDLQVTVRAWDGSGGVIEKMIQLNQEAVDPGRKARISFEGGAAVLAFESGSAYSRFVPQAQTFKPDIPPYYTYGGAAFAFGPESVALDEKAQILLRYPATVQKPEKLAVYWDGGDGKWIFAGNDLDRQARLVGAQSRKLGRCALLFDEEAPAISRVHPAEGEVVAQRRPSLSAEVVDRGAGIGSEDDVVLKLDGNTIIAEYDPDAQTVRGHLFTDLEPGTHTLEVQVTDQSGNRRLARSVFTVQY